MQLLGKATAEAWHGGARAGGSGEGRSPRGRRPRPQKERDHGALPAEPLQFPAGTGWFRPVRAVRPEAGSGLRDSHGDSDGDSGARARHRLSVRRGILHPGEGSFIPSPSPPPRAFLPARSDRLCQQVTLSVPKDACWKHRTLQVSLLGQPSKQSRNSGSVRGERCQRVTSPGPFPLCPRARCSPNRWPGMAEVRWPELARFSAEVCRGHLSAAPWESQSQQCPRAGVPSWGPGARTGKRPCPRVAALNLLPSEGGDPRPGWGCWQQIPL